MTALPLPAIRALHAGASEGPWDVNDDGEIFDADFCLVVGTKWPHGAPTRQLKLDPNNAAFIAAAPSIVTQLLAKIDAVEAELAATEQRTIEGWGHGGHAVVSVASIRAALTGEGQL